MAGRRTAAFFVALIALAGALAGCERGGDPAEKTPVQSSGRIFGVASDPWRVDEWSAEVGAKPSLVMEFEAWSRDRTIDSHFAEVRRQGIRNFMLTWEPWRTVDASKGRKAQYVDQPEFNNAAIAAGKKDDYIRAVARSVAASGLTVYVRYAHEMNGNWYPWSRDPVKYVAAWRHVVTLFREEGADNARFVFSVNPSVYEPEQKWLANVRRYWPGGEYVDLVGATMINFGGQKNYPVEIFTRRFELLHKTFDKKLIITEFNTARQGRVRWLSDLRTWLDTTGAEWAEGAVLSQGDSRGAAQLGNRVGDLSWTVTDDDQVLPIVRAMIEDLNAAPS